MMTPEQYIVATYVLFWLIRIQGCLRRGRHPLSRGKEWFLTVRVPEGFYEGPGRMVLRRYWMRMLIPFAIDIPFAIAIFWSGRIWLLNILIIGLCALIHVNHLYSVDIAERQARRYAMPQEPMAVALSLQTRRLRDYTNWAFETVVVLLNAGIIGWLIRYVTTQPHHPGLWRVFAAPVLLVYLQAGLLFVKWLLVIGRTPVPHSDAVDYMNALERLRKFRLQFCDLTRLSFALAIIFVPIRVSLRPAMLTRAVSIWLFCWLIITIVLTIWGEIQRKRVMVHRVQLPDFQRLSDVARPLLCYEPSAPGLILRSANGLSLNLASPVAQGGFLYLAGLIAILAILPRPH